MAGSDQGISIDGRRQRGERTRFAIIDAALSLQEEGILVPTAQQISDRAGVLIRSFFRHFDDMETLFKAADDQLRDSYEALFIGGDRQGSLTERVNRAVERRSAAFEQLKNVVLGTKAQLWRYETLAQTTRGISEVCEKIWRRGYRSCKTLLRLIASPSMRVRRLRCGIGFVASKAYL
jgi:AcrR family transcriptional regulator